MRRTLTSLVAAALLGSGFAVTAPTSANAADGVYDLYDIQAADYHINTGSCRYITVTARAGSVPGPIREVTAEVDLWHGGQSISSISLESGADVTRLSGRYFFCPGSDNPGTYRLGPSRVSYEDEDYNDFDFVDNTTGVMRALQSTSLKNFSAKKKGSKKTFTVRGTYFAAGFSSQYASFPKGSKIVLQRKTSSGSWKYVKTAKVGKKGGRATFVINAKKKAQYRTYTAGTARSWPATSRTLTK
jgi:hypothetical protein